MLHWTAGPKIVHYDRVVWTTTPDAGTGVAALQTGEQDWQETTPHDLLPVIKAAGDGRSFAVPPSRPPVMPVEVDDPYGSGKVVTLHSGRDDHLG